MLLGGVCRRVVGAVVTLLWQPGMAAARGLSDPEKIAVSAVCVSVIVGVVVVLTIVCCRAKRLKKKKGTYHHVHDSSTLQSFYHPSKALPDSFTTYISGQGSRHHGGKSANGAVPAKIGRKLSDANDQRRYVLPEWRRQQDVRNGSYISAVHRSASDASAPKGIWTSNPTLTRGMRPSNVATTPTGSDKGRAQRAFSSVPALAEKIPSKKHRRSKYIRDSPYAVPYAEVSERIRQSKSHQPVRNNFTKLDDTKTLLPASSSEDTSSDKEHQVVARVYSNPGFVREGSESRSTGRSSGRSSPFVAKVYSDYQLPKDFIRPPPPVDAAHGTVAKAFSSSAAEGCAAERVVNVRRHASGPTGRARGHVARAVVRNSGSLDSKGEPKYARPQDALDVSRRPKERRKAARRVGRSRSSGERTARPRAADGEARKTRRPTSHVFKRPSKRGSFDVNNRPSTEIGGSPRDPYSDVVYTPNGVDRPPLTAERSARRKANKLAKQDAGGKKRAPSEEEKLTKNEPVASVKNVKNLALDLGAGVQERAAARGHVTARSRAAEEGSSDVQDSPVPVSEHSDSSSAVEPISESSSTRECGVLLVGGDALGADDPNAIYSAPMKKEGKRPDGAPTSSPEPAPEPGTPFSEVRDEPQTPRPPPVPPITKLREEPLTPLPPPVPPITRLREEPLTPSSPASSQQDEDSQRQTTDSAPETPSERLMSDPRTPLPSPLCRIKNNVHNEGDGISTGKKVIGDAFKFLEDFDDISLEADDRL